MCFLERRRSVRWQGARHLSKRDKRGGSDVADTKEDVKEIEGERDSSLSANASMIFPLMVENYEFIRSLIKPCSEIE